MGFQPIGFYLSGLEQAIIVSMGTGTALVKADKNQIVHMGGSGIGGGTLLGLSNRMLNVRDIRLLRELAEKGNLENIDLRVGDISRESVPGLPPSATASNFGKISDNASREDIALGIVNLVLQAIGVMAIMAAGSTSNKDVVLIGNMTSIPQGKKIFETLSELFGVNFIIPENARFATALGSALAYLQGKESQRIS
jgi:type II pantothenate kinase